MELPDRKNLLSRFERFFEECMKKQIREAIHKGQDYIEIDFYDILEYDTDLGDLILSFPEECIEVMQETLQHFFLDGKEKDAMKVRFKTLPDSEKLLIREIRSEHLKRLLLVEGIVRRKTDVRPRLTQIHYLCSDPECVFSEQHLVVPQLEEKMRIQKTCPRCRSELNQVEKVLIDAQHLVLEESSEQLENQGDQPKRINILLMGDLVSPFKESKTNPGSRVYVIGFVREIQNKTRTGAESINFDLIVDANYIGMSEENYSEITVSKEEEKDIKELAAKNDVMDILIANISPSIYGNERIKEAILLQLFGGTGSLKGDGTRVRGDIHVLLVGDPGAAKSQLLKAASKLAPKSSFVSGKSASGVGLTASVVRDEIMRGFALEAGAMVLASGGLCAIDELDKMSEDDTSAMHEALEQQCYHYDFELQFADGSSEKIGDYVENLFKKNKSKIIEGINCEILDIKTKELLTTDFNKIQKIVPKRISRHISPKNYYKIQYSNGRSITVTPEHPVFVYKKNSIAKISAEQSKKGMIVPLVRKTKIKGKKQKLNVIKSKKIELPKTLTADFSFFLGFYGAEGHNYINLKNRTYEIGFSNTNEDLINDIISKLEIMLKITLNKNIQEAIRRKNAIKTLYTGRILKREFYDFFASNFPEFMFKAPKKRIPQLIKMSTDDIKKAFLQSYFLGDGFYDSERCGFSTSSKHMAEDLQDLLLNLEIYSYVATEIREKSIYYKVVLTGEENLFKFKNIINSNLIVDVKKYKFKKIEKINEFLERSKRRLNSRDTVPYNFLIEFNKFLKKCHVSDGTFTTLISRKQNSHKKLVLSYLEKAKKKLTATKNEALLTELRNFEIFLTSEIRFGKIVSVEKIKNKRDKWVYDVSVPPTKTFISQGLVLHNTISVAKANIRATLRCETTVLGAANPKLGRFDPYGDIAKQINFPPALMSRFDLIYILKDIPNKKRDNLIASHILSTHKDVSKTITDIKPDFLKKYIAYAKKIKPQLTDEAIEKIKEFYISIRNTTADEDSPKPIPITPRQLEAIIRLSEAYAKIKLDKKVRIEHAQAAIDLLMFCLEKIGVDPKTGELDIDRITTGVTTSARNQFKSIQMIIDKLETEKPEILFDDICEEANKQNITRAEVDKILYKLKEEGIIFEPRKNLYKKLL